MPHPPPSPPPVASPHGAAVPATGSVVAAAVYAEGRRLCDIAMADAGAWTGQPGHLVWIGLYEPGEPVLEQLRQQFGLHPLAIEDALHAHQRPKIEQYGDGVFLVLRTAGLAHGRVAFGETHVFAGKSHVVTVRHGASASYAPVRARCEASPALLRHGADFVLYAIMDFVVDSYFPILDSLQAEVERLEGRLLRRPPTAQEVERIHQVRRDLESLRRAASPLLEVCLRLERFHVPMIDAEVAPYFRDVHDHVTRVNEAIDSLREVLRFAFDASMMLATMRQGDVMRRLAAWAAILAIPTAVAGIYGMNFDHMPELHWRYGYFAVLAGVAAVCGVLFVRFRRTGWL